MNGIFLQINVGHDDHGAHLACGGHTVGTHGRFGKVLQRARCVIPLKIVAQHQGGVLHRMRPFRARSALVGIDAIAAKHDDRHSVAPSVVHRHGRMLKTHTAVRHDGHGLA